MMEDTSGFYKRDPSGILLFGQDFVVNAKYNLTRAARRRYRYPIDGWAWYDSEEAARVALGFKTELQEIFDSLSDNEKRRLLDLRE